MDRNISILAVYSERTSNFSLATFIRNLEKPNELISIIAITNHTLKFFDYLVSIWRSIALVFQHDLGQMDSKASKDKDLALENLQVNKWLTCFRSKKELVIDQHRLLYF